MPWEHFHTLGNIAVFSQRQSEPAAEASACCAPSTPRGKPVFPLSRRLPAAERDEAMIEKTYNVLFSCTGN